MTRIKICGIKEEVHGLVAAEAGADFIGLVFAPSPRQVSVDQAQKIARVVKRQHRGAKAVGVFVNMPASEVNRITELCALDLVQLSGDETWDYCTGISKPIIKAVKVSGQGPENIIAELAEGRKTLGKQGLYLFDSKIDGRYGGTGKTFDWSLAQRITRDYPVILAGGLTPENVPQAIKIAKPWGVDVSSGVETGGTKDISRIKAFIQAVRSTDEK